METKKLIGFVAVVALVLSVIGLFTPSLPIKEQKMPDDVAAAPGNLLAENYIPFVLYNDGYSSAKGITLSGANGDITTGDDLTVADDATVTDDLTVSGGSLSITTSNSATSTITVGCIQTYATNTATAVRLTLSPFTGTTTTQGAASNFLVAAQFGSCPI